jgi:hypothetical protein
LLLSSSGGISESGAGRSSSSDSRVAAPAVTRNSSVHCWRSCTTNTHLGATVVLVISSIARRQLEPEPCTSLAPTTTVYIIALGCSFCRQSNSQGSNGKSSSGGGVEVVVVVVQSTTAVAVEAVTAAVVAVVGPYRGRSLQQHYSRLPRLILQHDHRSTTILHPPPLQ